MKQLRFFTNHAATLKATQDELEKKGITAEKLHIFIKDNSRHSYDGLVLQSERGRENVKIRWGTLSFVALTFLASLALLNGLISFLGFAAVIGCYSLVPLLSKKSVREKYANKEALKKVYFLIVDVKDNEEGVVTRIAKHHSDLIPQ